MTIAQVQSSQPAPQPSIADELFSVFGIEGLLMLSGVGLIIVVNLVVRAISGGSNKNVLSTASWATKADEAEARKLAVEQIKGKKHDRVALWINSPEEINGYTPKGLKHTIWIPDAERGLSIIGGSGTGKSYSGVKPLLRSAISQGLPTVLLDTDYPGLAKTIAPLAESVGYDVEIFAPGFPESRIYNVLDFIESSKDATGASQISKTLHKNFSKGQSGKDDLFFQVSGELATEASLLLAKALKHKDILTAFAILKDEDMIARVRGVGKIDPWLEVAFGQLLSTAKSEKTVDSIRGTAALLFGQLMRPDILPALIGPSTMSLDVTGKKLLIFGVKQDIRLVVSPLIAAIIHAIITRNVLPGREESLFLSLDEVPSMYFPEISEWLSEKRKYGLCTQIGYQSLEQLKSTYGPELADVIFTNTATKLLFNPQSVNSAELFSKTLGDTDVVYKTKSRSYGKSRSRTNAEHRATKRLFTPDQFMSLGEGSCVLVSPGYGKKRKFTPVLLDPITISKKEMDIQSATENVWDDFLDRAIATGVNNRRIAPTEITQRVEDFRARLPPVKGNLSGDELTGLLGA